MSYKNLFLLVLMLSMVVMASQAQSPFKLKDGDTIVFLGDSITQAGAKPEGYVSLFKMHCDMNGYEVKVINAGISGHKSNQMLARLQKDVLDHKPDWVSISCGVNDVWHQFSHSSEGVKLPEYKKNMTEMVERCQKAGVKVLLLTATPIYEDPDSPENQMLKKYNDFLRQLAKEKDLVLCDLNKTFMEWYERKLNDLRIMTTDGVHMNHRGNRIMAREIAIALDANWREIRRTQKRWELVNNMCK